MSGVLVSGVLVSGVHVEMMLAVRMSGRAEESCSHEERFSGTVERTPASEVEVKIATEYYVFHITTACLP